MKAWTKPLRPRHLAVLAAAFLPAAHALYTWEAVTLPARSGANLATPRAQQDRGDAKVCAAAAAPRNTPAWRCTSAFAAAGACPGSAICWAATA